MNATAAQLAEKWKNLRTIFAARLALLAWEKAGRLGQPGVIAGNMNSESDFGDATRFHADEEWDGITSETWAEAKRQLPGLTRAEFDSRHRKTSLTHFARWLGENMPTPRAWLNSGEGGGIRPGYGPGSLRKLGERLEDSRVTLPYSDPRKVNFEGDAGLFFDPKDGMVFEQGFNALPGKFIEVNPNDPRIPHTRFYEELVKRRIIVPVPRLNPPAKALSGCVLRLTDGARRKRPKKRAADEFR